MIYTTLGLAYKEHSKKLASKSFPSKHADQFFLLVLDP
ncbi:hypothetical protein NEOC65_001963 [Neochlamydia sp. AcF65]|nr:hypothetical protein [Neochlamydia sp. AcF65]MBS4169793.1 hypothetical protein [Neochlamydia sp. AcF95]